MVNSCLVGVQGDSSFYGNQRDTLILLLVCVELDNTPLLCKLRYLWGLESIPCILRYMPIHALPVEFSIDTTYIATDVLYERLVLNLPTSQFTYSHFAYKFHFAYKCVSFRLHTGNYDLEGLSRYKTDFDLL